MICDSCKIDRLDNEFLNNLKICYHCAYKEKLKKSMEKQTRAPLLCRICKNCIPSEKDLKKKPRTVFCSLECARIGQRQLTNNYWTRKLPSWRTA